MAASKDETDVGTFWEHLDVLRGCLFRIAIVTVLLAVAAFCFKDLLFKVVLAPKSSDFITYRLFGVEPFDVHLMNIGLTEQFMIHMKTALYAGLLLASPYILYQLFGFIAPGLYANERKYAIKVAGWGYVMFLMGSALNYFIIFPMTVRFLGTYQVSEEVANMLTLQSYMDTLLMMNLVMGIIFELPVVCWLLARLGFLTDKYMRLYRRHAIVAILIVAAIITPTTDVFTLMIVSLPIYLLYEVSIAIVKVTVRKKAVSADEADEE